MSIQTLLLGLGTLGILAGCAGGDEDGGDLEPEICDNGIDDDGDDLVDCDDREECPGLDIDDVCYADPPPCEAGNEDQIPVIQAGTLAEPIFLADLGFAAADLIAEPGDRDCFAFDPVEGQLYILYLEHRGANPDTVLQVFDSSFQLIGENDDLPYRITETDSGMEFVAQSNDTLYFQVLEFSDWDPDTETAEGGQNFKYDVLLSAIDLDEPNEDVGNDDFVQAATNAAAGEPGPLFDPYEGSIDWLPGTIGAPGDVDVVQFEVLGDRLCQFSSYPHLSLEGMSPALSSLDHQWELWREDCDPFAGDCTGENVVRVASTTDPAIYSNSVRAITWDAGISYPVPGAGVYYLRITDASGGGSPLHAYQVWANCAFTDIVHHDENGSDDVTEATRIPLEESTATEGLWFGDIAGTLFGGTTPDTIDSWNIRDGVRPNAVATVFVETTTAGSSLSDAVVKIWRDNGDGTAAELASGTGSDPLIVEAVLTDSSNLFVTFESTSNIDATDAFYVARVFVSNESLDL